MKLPHTPKRGIPAHVQHGYAWKLECVGREDEPDRTGGNHEGIRERGKLSVVGEHMIRETRMQLVIRYLFSEGRSLRPCSVFVMFVAFCHGHPPCLAEAARR